MFDIHAHIGEYNENCLVATSYIEEFDKLSQFKSRAYGSLSFNKEDICVIKEYLKKDDNGLIGEIGLDKRFNIAGQEEFLREAIKLGKANSRPIIFHLVGHYDIFFKLLAELAPIPPFLVHGFTGSYEVAKRIINSGGYISLSPRAQRCKSYKSLLKLPFLLETDLKSGEEEIKTLYLWYNTVSKDIGIKANELEEIIDERRTVFTPWKINWKR